jgi:hypothetical protein
MMTGDNENTERERERERERKYSYIPFNYPGKKTVQCGTKKQQEKNKSRSKSFFRSRALNATRKGPGVRRAIKKRKERKKKDGGEREREYWCT